MQLPLMPKEILINYLMAIISSLDSICRIKRRAAAVSALSPLRGFSNANFYILIRSPVRTTYHSQGRQTLVQSHDKC